MDVFIVIVLSMGDRRRKIQKIVEKVSNSIHLWVGIQWKIDLIHVFLDSFLF